MGKTKNPIKLLGATFKSAVLNNLGNIINTSYSVGPYL